MLLMSVLSHVARTRGICGTRAQVQTFLQERSVTCSAWGALLLPFEKAAVWDRS